MNRETAPTLAVSIYIGGDTADAERICRQFCYEVGLCVTVESVTFLYTGGQEAGVRVGLINYPRFPTNEPALMERAEVLARLMIEGLFQHSASIVGPAETVWLSRRVETASSGRRGVMPKPALPIDKWWADLENGGWFVRQETTDGSIHLVPSAKWMKILSDGALEASRQNDSQASGLTTGSVVICSPELGALMEAAKRFNAWWFAGRDIPLDMGVGQTKGSGDTAATP